MKTENTLNVWHDKNLVGVLEQNPAGVISFRYDEHWVKVGFAISQDLPLQTAEYSSELGKAHRFSPIFYLKLM